MPDGYRLTPFRGEAFGGGATLVDVGVDRHLSDHVLYPL